MLYVSIVNNWLLSFLNVIFRSADRPRLSRVSYETCKKIFKNIQLNIILST